MSTLLVLGLGLTLPAVLSFLDCLQRDGGDFAEGARDRRAWLLWLGIALVTSWFGVGYIIVLGYYYTVVRRNSPMM